MKQKLEEAAEEYYERHKIHLAKDIFRPRVVDIFKSGAEWQSNQSPWISVKERLPENEDRVLVLCKMKRFNSYFTLVNNYIDGEWETKILAHYDTVAWMPIPSFDEILEANRDVLERIKEKGD
jgi:hypothetical protein